VIIDEQIGNIDAGDFDALFIPGGYSPDRLRGEEGPVAFVRKFMQGQKTHICHLSCPATADNLRRSAGAQSDRMEIDRAGH
jgi:protease I